MSRGVKAEATDFENVISKDEMPVFWEIVIARAKTGNYGLLKAISDTAGEFAAAKHALANGHPTGFFSTRKSDGVSSHREPDALIKGELFKSITTTKLKT